MSKTSQVRNTYSGDHSTASEVRYWRNRDMRLESTDDRTSEEGGLTVLKMESPSQRQKETTGCPNLWAVRDVAAR